MWMHTLMCPMALQSQWVVQLLVEVDTCQDLHLVGHGGLSQCKVGDLELQSHLILAPKLKALQNNSLPNLPQEICGLRQ